VPRRYSLGKRAEGVIGTRRRIVRAAAALYREQGVSRTTMLAVARKADVAPATVLNHFPTRDVLAGAVAELVREELRMPDAAMLDELPTVEARVRWLSRELAGFYEHSEPWYEVYRQEVGGLAAWDEARDDFFHQVGSLVRRALGPLAEDDLAAVVTDAMLEPSVSGALRGRGLTAESAGGLLADLLVPWLEGRGGGRGSAA
jgi:AcrR family transcriptional regulator